ncbi:aspartic proteinase [Colletotrichum graminicola M1.001]|uniref:Aspartic proteinase n=1 Tax=Colletotrichum graminicola (strain M1.001 / M2 / FGSC 10212) TaxID=645133 RepID=E3QH25_COLGM|nr:aspartic proteinase [Colletotrichum graminicola M1.001]EFQ30187.1 aspartic proteinase [Colletotrichum graminicola M1.001]
MKASFLLVAAACAAVAEAEVHLPYALQSPLIAAAAADSGVKSRTPDDRRSMPTLDILTDGWNYLVNVSVGTPPQQMSMRLNVQASASWVPNVESCDSSSRRYINASSYYEEYIRCTEKINKLIGGEYVVGDWISDVLDLAGTRIPKFVMGGVEIQMADTMVGVLGLGYNESYYHSDVEQSDSTTTLTVPERLVKDGLITSPAYSLWLDDKSAKSGKLLLGAIDRSKFEGPLIRIRTNSFSASSASGRTKTFDTVIHSVNGTESATDDLKPLGNGSLSSSERYYLYENRFLPVKLAPESTLSVLPPALAQDSWFLAGAFWNADLLRTVIPCTVAEKSTGHIVMQLDGTDGPVLNVSIADLGTHNSLTGYSIEDYVLGGAVSKQAYIVFNLANAEMAIAQTKSKHEKTQTRYMVAVRGNPPPTTRPRRLPREYRSTDLRLTRHVELIGTTLGLKISVARYRAARGHGITATEDIVPYCFFSINAKYSPECTGDGSGAGNSGKDGNGDGGYGGYGDICLPSSISRSIKLGVGLGVGLLCLVVICLSIWAIRRCRRIRKAEEHLSEKQADMEQGAADARIGAGGGDNVAQDVSLPQKPPSAVTREPPTTDAAEGRDNLEDAVSTRP